MISVENVEHAARTIAGRVHRTPLLSSSSLSAQLDAEVVFKVELFQRTGAHSRYGAR